MEGPSASAAAGRSWTPHGRVLTACLVAPNVLLVYVYFWRFFSRRGHEEDAAAAEEEENSPPASPKAEVERAIAALPVFVHSSSSHSPGGGKVECAICIAEFADGEEGRLLPRCGHRFHARCVDTWFSFHTTCPLCRATVLHVHPNKPPPAAVVNTTDTESGCPE
jgi:hypothetical protein